MDFIRVMSYFLYFPMELKMILKPKYNISTALTIENPVKSPMNPPIAERISSGFAALSFVILSNVGVSKCMLMNCSLLLSNSYSRIDASNLNIHQYTPQLSSSLVLVLALTLAS